MALLSVNFTFHTGLKYKRFSNVRLSGSWDATGSENSSQRHRSFVLAAGATQQDYGTAGTLHMDYFAGALLATQ
jgi:hypothetical protein